VRKTYLIEKTKENEEKKKASKEESQEVRQTKLKTANADNKKPL
jgi:hypothetical protein